MLARAMPPPPRADRHAQISGGTGFAPFFQLLHHTLLEPSPSVAPMPRVTLLHASRSPQDLPPPALLDPLHAFARAHPDRLRVQLFVDAPAPAPADGAPAPPAAVQRIDAAAVQDALGIAAPPRAWWQLWPAAASPPPPPKRGVLFLVCGPEPWVLSWTVCGCES
jgi:cytochrome-b5 reductase